MIRTRAPESLIGAPAGVTGAGFPARSDDSTTRSTAKPVPAPDAVCTVCEPAPSATLGAHGSRSSPLRASRLGPTTETGNGAPSTVTRSLRHPESMVAGAAGTGIPGMSAAMIDTGISAGPDSGPVGTSCGR